MRFQIIQAIAGLVLVTHVGAHIGLSVTVDNDESHMEAATGLLAEWRDPSIMECCRADEQGYCRDGTGGTPYCGYGKCNFFGCNCDGGCRKAKKVKGVVTSQASLEDPSIMECCRADEQGYCRDGTGGTPYCGYGKCNFFGCNCDGGCRKAKKVEVKKVEASVPTLEDPSIMECCPSLGGICADGTAGTPYCGNGQCNVFGCNCDGGCRKPTNCCHTDSEGHCDDGTKGTPYCGYGRCNVLGCNCDGGCRKPGPFSGLFTDDIVKVTSSEAYEKNMQEMMQADL